MPKSLEIGFNYFQEHAPADDALDEGTTIAIVPSVTVDGGPSPTFSRCSKYPTSTAVRAGSNITRRASG